MQKKTCYLSSSYIGNPDTIINCRKVIKEAGYEVKEYIKGQLYDRNLLKSCDIVIIAVPVEIVSNKESEYYFVTGKGTFSEGQDAVKNNIPLFCFDNKNEIRSIERLELDKEPEVKSRYGICFVSNTVKSISY